MEKLDRAQKMLNFGASKPKVRGTRPPAPPPGGSVPVDTKQFQFMSSIHFTLMTFAPLYNPIFS